MSSQEDAPTRAETQEQPTLEQYLEELRDINTQLQNDDMRMQEALELYRAGAGIAKKAEQLLEQYKTEIEIIDLEGEQNA